MMSLGYHDGHLLGRHSTEEPVFTAHSNDPFCRIDYVLFSSSFFGTSLTLPPATEAKIGGGVGGGGSTTVTATERVETEMDHKVTTASATTPLSIHDHAKQLAATVASVWPTTTPVVTTTTNGTSNNSLVVKRVFVDTTAHGSDHFPLCCDLVMGAPTPTKSCSLR
jgi:endonuclease/exonuclease/phosphatase family metal-dependent hydrolase